MKILILTEGGKNIGFGHLTRCISLYQAFFEKKITPELLINGDTSLLPLLSNENYQILNWLKKETQLFEMIKSDNIIIIDSYLAKKDIYDRISEITNGKLAMIDDFNRLEYPKGMVVNPGIYGDKFDYSKRNDTVYLLGKEFIILRQEFWNIGERDINENIKNILITFGGINDNFTLRTKLINYLKDRFDFNFITTGHKNKVGANKMRDWMLKADICISGGGQTTYELARCGLPTIGICFAENQLGNLEGWSNIGFLEFVGWYNDKNLFEKIEEALKKLDYEKRIKMSQIGQGLVDGQGARRVVKNIIFLLQYLY